MKDIKKLPSILIGLLSIGVPMLIGYILSLFKYGYIILFVAIGLIVCLLIGNMVMDVYKEYRRIYPKGESEK